MTNRSDHATTSRSTHHAFHALMVIGLISVFGVLFALTLRLNQSVSELENRRLANWPTLSSQTFLDGSYTRDIEKYVADHFPGRRWLTEAAFAIRTYRGVQLGDRVIQVKGAETGFEDVSKWASATEDTSPDVPTQTHDTNDIAVSEAPNQPANTELVVVNTLISNEETVRSNISNVEPEKELSVDPVSENEKEERTEAKITPPMTLPLETPAVSMKPSIDTPEVIASIAPPKSIDSIPPEPLIPLSTTPVVVAPVNISVPDSKPESKPESNLVTSASTSRSTPSKPAATKQPTPVEATQAKPLNVVGGVLLHEGQALFMFQGTDRGAQGYANAVNTWVELVAKKRPGMTSTVVVTPTSSHFYLPPAARAKTTSEPKNLAAMRAALLPEVRFADVVTEMEGHQDEALFFKSDHHWTGLGAYYAYRAWARANGVTPLELSAFSKRSVPGVAGSFWSLTQAPELRNADKESYYYVPTTVTFDGTQYAGPQQKTPMPQPFFAEKSRGYIVFLGGDIPLLVSNTSARTGRTALVVKNSYGNAFAPYLLPHFDRVVVLDYRYVSRNIQDIVDTFGVTDLVFVNATITANSGAHQERMRQVARGSSTAWLTEAEKRRLKQQEDAAAKTQASAAVSDKAQ